MANGSDLPTYSLSVQNQSGIVGTVCLFQQSEGPGVYSLAWLVAGFLPGGGVQFEWQPAYCFVWAQTGQLAPGVIFQAAQTLPAGLDSSNLVGLTSVGSELGFTAPVTGSPGTLTIVMDSTVPQDRFAAGIGIGDLGTVAVQAAPNINFELVPLPSSGYWLTIGSYSQGQVLDRESLPYTVEISFPSGIFAMTATLGPDGSWQVVPAG